MRLQLVIAIDQHAHAMGLRKALEGCVNITIVELPMEKFPVLTDLNAIFLPLPMAERWGSRPILHKAQILRTHSINGTPCRDMPPYVITGVAMALEDPQDPVFELRLILTAILEAVQAWNTEHLDTIKVIGVWAGNLCIDQLAPEHVGKIVRSVHEKMLSSFQSASPFLSGPNSTE